LPISSLLLVHQALLRLLAVAGRGSSSPTVLPDAADGW
jgi:hypothetical protein